jgi:MFS family permease
LKNYLPIIVLSQFLGTSLWFAGNAVLGDLAASQHLPGTFVAHLTSAVQLGFIAGTLTYALLSLPDRYSPSLVFFLSSVLAALCNLVMVLPHAGEAGILSARFLTGFFLAGIYPVGMKIASDHYLSGLSKSLGFLVGALVFGTAFPHLVRRWVSGLPWQDVVYATSALALCGGLAIRLWVPDGPHHSRAAGIRLNAVFEGYRKPAFRSAAFGYFGHMWELYTFWAFVPVMLAAYNSRSGQEVIDVSLWSFFIIAMGGLACMGSGLLALKSGARRIAAISLAASGACCLVSPAVLSGSTAAVLLAFLLFWGLVVQADSPLYSSLVAQHAPASARGASLAITNSIGFFITVPSMQLIGWLTGQLPLAFCFLFLAVGPALGLLGLLWKSKPEV